MRFWYALYDAAIAAVRHPGKDILVGRVSYRYEDPFLRLTLPSGRPLSYPFAKIDGRDKYGRPKLSFLDNTAGAFTPCRFGQGAWFGLLVENVVQAASRDLLAAAMLRLEGAGYGITLHVHDELVAEVPNGFGSLEEFRRIVETAPAWAEGLPIACKARESLRFAKEGALSSSSPELERVVALELDQDDRNSSMNSTEPAVTAGTALPEGGLDIEAEDAPGEDELDLISASTLARPRSACHRLSP